MANKNNIFKDKSMLTLTVISAIAAAALIGGLALDDGGDAKNNEKQIVDLNENTTTKYSNSKVANSNASKEKTTTKPIVKEESTEVETTSDVNVNAPASNLTFTRDSILTWPIDGNIIIEYDMENTVYFPTLDIYKCSDAIVISSEIGTPIYASRACVVSDINENDEIGNFVCLNLGNDYELTLGQLKDIAVETGDSLEKGDLIGYINAPTDYYSVEGPNLFLKLTEKDIPIDPLNHLDY